ncbi:TonB-dependent receptor family protein [Plastoroseomonas arctica]|uniref:TonB-dependent receptor n=1 Tax=Plastoroseomonas arctica TaxID=1509237 RepID=A0AAF1KT50_9PROT|nr:TonB-dependent receptor [Plastoroseomonas arctica]MBR0655032.1 TonB-dependent receptor [Plastoroseomonas arctica]
MTLRARLLASAALVLPCVALAQSLTAIPPITVTAVPPVATVPDNAAAEEIARQNPGNVSIVPAERFRDRAGVRSLQDALEFTPGVFAPPKWGEDTRLSIRGSGLARNFHLRGVRLLQDGVPLNQADGSGDFQELDPLTLQRLEVYRGANAFALGANALGGAINAVTPTGRTSPGGLVRLEAGSNSFVRGQLAYGYANGASDAYISVTGLGSEGVRDHSAARNVRINANVGYRITDDVETRVYVTYNNIFQQIPGVVTRGSALNTPRVAAPANLLNNYQRNIESTRLGSITTWRVQEGVVIEAGGGFVRRELDHPIFQYIDQRNDDFNLFLRATLDFRVFGLENRLRAGVNSAIGETDSLRYVNLNGRPTAQLTASSQDRARTNDAYVENTLRITDTVGLIAGAQVGEAYRASRDRFLQDGNGSGSGRWQWVNPRVGVIWDYAPTAQLFANLSWSTEPPTLSDLTPLVPVGGFSRLKAQRATTLEVGTRGTIGPVRFEAALYRAWIRDEIQLISTGPSTSLALNLDRTIHQGVELGAEWTALANGISEGDALTLRGAYTFSDFRFDGDARFRNNQLPGAPRHFVVAEGRYSHPAGGWIAPNVTFLPESFLVDSANTTRTSSYALLGLRAGWNFSDRVSVFADARNLTDKRYVASASVAPTATANSLLFEPGAGRAVYAGLQLRF